MFTINNQLWYLYLVDPDDYVLLTPEGQFALGVYDRLTNSMYISNSLDSELFERVLSHEISHLIADVYGLVLTHDEEELLASLIEVYGEEIIDLTDMVLDAMRRGRY